MAPPIEAQKNTASIPAIVQQISSLSLQIQSHLTDDSFFKKGLSGELGGVPETPEYEALRLPLNDLLHQLLRIVNGPKNTLRELLFSHYDLAALQIALDRRFFEHIPLPLVSTPGNGLTASSVADIARKASMDEDRTGRVLKLLATHGIFEEVEGRPGLFTHSVNSAYLARNPDFCAVADMQMDDMFKVASEASVMISSSPLVTDPSQSAFHKRFGSSLYQYYEQRPEKARRFAQAMSSWTQVHRHADELYDGFPWASLGNGKVIDIGGGSGHTSVELGRIFPRLNFVVQDISSEMFAQADIRGLGDHVTFQQHNFFDTQPVHDASAFILSQCIHNYDDRDAARIIRAVVPALERCGRGTPLLISDIVLPDTTSSGTANRSEQHHARQIDLCMMLLQGAKERNAEEFRRIIKEADPRLEVVTVRRNPTGLGLIQVQLAVE
ncbi:putative O-methyltransferase [Nemania sp. FL0916]|nr:putative O-methyltransferase [Nemania sp. FL0916]